MGDLKVKYFPKGEILGDYFTKPLQGTVLRRFRSEIQGIPEDTPDTDLGWDIPVNTFIPIQQEGVDRSDVKTDKISNDSQELINAEQSK